MRKIIAAAAAAAVLLTFAGCGNNGSGENLQPSSFTELMNSELVAPNENTDGGNGLSTVTKLDASSVNDNVVNITKAGEYELSGEIKGQVVINVPSEAKVKLTLNGASITNDGLPCIYVKNADKVVISCEDNTVNVLECTGPLVSTDDGKKLDGALFARDDLQVSGHGTLVINCEQGHGIVAKDDLDIKNLSLDINVFKKGIQVNDCCTIMSGTIRIKSASEGIEAFIVDIIDGTVDIDSGSDGLNATDKHNSKSDPFKPGGGAVIYIKGGSVSISAGGDGIDSNGDIFISGGELTVSAFNNGRDSAIDYAGRCEITGGTQNVPEDYGREFMQDQSFQGL